MNFLKRLFLLLLIFLMLLSGCRKAEQASPAKRPRIISLSPAVTRIIFESELQGYLVGVTNFCQTPDLDNIARVGDAKSLNVEQIISLDPDIIVGQVDMKHVEIIKKHKPDVVVKKLTIESLDDIPAAAEQIADYVRGDLEKRQAPEYGSSFYTVDQVRAMMMPVVRAYSRAGLFESRKVNIKKRTEKLKPKRVLFVMGSKNFTTAAEGSFIHEMIELAGGINVGNEIPGPPRWRDVTIESIHKSQPEVIICQVFSGAEKKEAKLFWKQWKDLPAVKEQKVFVFDDPNWTIPSLAIIDYCATMEDCIHGPFIGNNDWD